MVLQILKGPVYNFGYRLSDLHQIFIFELNEKSLSTKPKRFGGRSCPSISSTYLGC